MRNAKESEPKQNISASSFSRRLNLFYKNHPMQNNGGKVEQKIFILPLCLCFRTTYKNMKPKTVITKLKLQPKLPTTFRQLLITISDHIVMLT